MRVAGIMTVISTGLVTILIMPIIIGTLLTDDRQALAECMHMQDVTISW